MKTRYKIRVTEHPLFKTVTGVKASKKTKTSLTLKWTNQKNVTKYQVKYRAKGGKWQYKTVAKNTLTLKSLKKNTNYQVMVRAYCKKGFDAGLYKVANWSRWSDTKTLKTAK